MNRVALLQFTVPEVEEYVANAVDRLQHVDSAVVLPKPVNTSHLNVLGKRLDGEVTEIGRALAHALLVLALLFRIQTSTRGARHILARLRCVVSEVVERVGALSTRVAVGSGGVVTVGLGLGDDGVVVLLIGWRSQVANKIHAVHDAVLLLFRNRLHRLRCSFILRIGCEKGL